MQPIRVLVIDDSALMRKLVSEILQSDPDIEVIGTAVDPYDARDKIKQLKPDVLTLDIEMPKMDGLTFLKNLMRLNPLPVVMLSTLTERGADVTLTAINLGAVDYVPKPKVDAIRSFQDCAEELIEKVKNASTVKVVARGTAKKVTPSQKVNNDNIMDNFPELNTLSKRGFLRKCIIAIGASTGGTVAIREVIERLPACLPPIVITQHIPAEFSLPFAKRVDEVSQITVKEAADGDELQFGHAYIAPGSHHLLLENKNGQLVCRLNDGPPVNRHKPAVDVLFDSVAGLVGNKAVGVLLTGMGKDGAEGLLKMRKKGAATIAQDEKTSAVWGMPGAAVKLSAAREIKPLQSVPETILTALSQLGEKKAS